MRFKTSKANLAEVDMTPMIDIVFQLIAFFMVISNFEQTQADERVKLPRDTLAKPPEFKEEHEMVLNIGFERDKEGNKTDPNPYIFWAGDKFPVLEFGPKFNQETRLYKSKNVEPANVTVSIRADKDVQTGLVQELIKLAQESGYSKFKMKANQAVDGT